MQEIVNIIGKAHQKFLNYRFQPFDDGKKKSFVKDLAKGGQLLAPSEALNKTTSKAFPESRIGNALVKMAFNKAEPLQQIVKEIQGAGTSAVKTNLELLNWLRSMNDEEFIRAEEEAGSKEQKDCPGECVCMCDGVECFDEYFLCRRAMGNNGGRNGGAGWVANQR
jgi:hypothetical protein